MKSDLEDNKKVLEESSDLGNVNLLISKIREVTQRLEDGIKIKIDYITTAALFREGKFDQSALPNMFGNLDSAFSPVPYDEIRLIRKNSLELNVYDVTKIARDGNDNSYWFGSHKTLLQTCIDMKNVKVIDTFPHNKNEIEDIAVLKSVSEF